MVIDPGKTKHLDIVNIVMSYKYTIQRIIDIYWEGAQRLPRNVNELKENFAIVAKKWIVRGSDVGSGQKGVKRGVWNILALWQSFNDVTQS